MLKLKNIQIEIINNNNILKTRYQNILLLQEIFVIFLVKGITNLLRSVDLGDNCIQNFHLGKYIVRYTVGNLVLQRQASGAVKCDFRMTYIRRYTCTSPNENFEYGYPHSNALLQSLFKLERCKPYKAAHHPTIFDIINDVKLFPTVYRKIYCRKFFMLSNQT